MMVDKTLRSRRESGILWRSHSDAFHNRGGWLLSCMDPMRGRVPSMKPTGRLEQRQNCEQGHGPFYFAHILTGGRRHG